MIDVFYVPKWRCGLGHEHGSLVAAERCEKLREPPWQPPAGFMYLYDARDRLWDAGVEISAREIKMLCKEALVQTLKYPDHPKGRTYVNVEDLDRALDKRNEQP